MTGSLSTAPDIPRTRPSRPRRRKPLSAPNGATRAVERIETPRPSPGRGSSFCLPLSLWVKRRRIANGLRIRARSGPTTPALSRKPREGKRLRRRCVRTGVISPASPSRDEATPDADRSHLHCGTKPLATRRTKPLAGPGWAADRVQVGRKGDTNRGLAGFPCTLPPDKSTLPPPGRGPSDGPDQARLAGAGPAGMGHPLAGPKQALLDLFSVPAGIRRGPGPIMAASSGSNGEIPCI